jgi:hypothetical protein
MNCPSCNTPIQDDLVIKAAASIIGARGRGACKRRDSKLMSEAGKKGGWPKGRPRKKLKQEQVHASKRDQDRPTD